MNLDYSSVIILKENTLGGGKSRVRSSETQLPTLAVHNISKMFPREQRKKELEIYFGHKNEWN